MNYAICDMAIVKAGFHTQNPAITDELQRVGVQVRNPRNPVEAEFVEFVIARRVLSARNARKPRNLEGCRKCRGVRHISLTNHEIHEPIPKGSENATLSTSVSSRPISTWGSSYLFCINKIGVPA